MRVMVLVKATPRSETGFVADEKLLTAMGAFNERLAAAGVLVTGDGLKPSREGKRVRFDGGPKAVVDGPFAETKELVAGFWIWRVGSIDEAVEWVRQCPDPMPGEASEIEIRPLYEAEDFAREFGGEARGEAARVYAQVPRPGEG